MATTSDPTVATRRAAVEDLGAAARSLVRAVVETEVDDETLARAASLAREAASLLAGAVRPLARLARVDGHGIRDRIYSPVGGRGNPIAPPLRVVTADVAAGRLEAECTLHRGYEGPATYVHGGVSAMLLDQVLGEAVALSGRIGLTRSLETSYRRPVPLEEPLRLTGWVVGSSGARLEAAGQIATAARPDVALVTATAIFVLPTPAQLARLFGHVETDGRPVPTGD